MQTKNIIHQTHRQEWFDSAIDPDIIDLNLSSLEGTAPYEYLLSSPRISRRNDGRLRDGDLRRYLHIENGGWWCSGIDPLDSYQPMQWGCFKPNTPRRSAEKVHKIIKYEHPYLEPTQAFFLQVSPAIWDKISKRCGIPITKEDTQHPYGFWHWVFKQNVPLIIVEGAKKAACLLSAGYAAVALPGVNSGYRNPKSEDNRPIGKPFLIPQLQHFATPQRRIDICFDRDTKIETIERVRQATRQLARLLTAKECLVRVIELPPATQKGVDDFIAANGQAAIDALYNSATPLELWQIKLYSLLTYKSAIALNRRFLDNISIPDSEKLIVIKSPKGTGKTEFLTKEVARAHDCGQRVLVITHRIQLGEALCDRFGVDYVAELKTSQTGGVLGYGLCVDSMHINSQARFNPDDWHNAVVIIDECDQVFWHLLNSRTEIRKNRVTILRNFKKLLSNVLSHAKGKIYLASADVTDIEVNYVKILAGYESNPFVICNNYQPRLGKAYIYPGRDPRYLIAALKEDIKNGGIPLICCSAQKAKSRWSTQSIAEMLANEFPSLKILRIDSETVGDPTQPAYGCISHLNEILPLYDIIIVSPSVETGVSIDIKGHFTNVWMIAQGIQPENSVRQMLARLREHIPRHLWISNYGIIGCRIGNGSSSFQSLLLSQRISTRAHIALLTAADYQSDFDFDAIDCNFQNESLRSWAYKACVINAGMKRYKEAVLEGLIADGYDIVNVENILGNPEEVAIEASNICDRLYETECQLIAAAAVRPEAEIEKLQEKRSKTKDERYELRKANLINAYGVELTPHLIKLDDAGWYKQLRLHYYLTIGRDYLVINEAKKTKLVAEAGDGAVWQPDFNKGQFLTQVLLLEELKILQLLETGKQFKGSDSELVNIATLSQKNKYIIKNYLGISIGDNQAPISIAQKLLSKLGCKLSFIGQARIEGKVRRIYEFKPPNDGRELIMEVWLKRELVLLSHSG